MDLVTDTLGRRIERTIVRNASSGRFDRAAKHTLSVAAELHASIPKAKRSSYGIYYTIKMLGQSIYELLRSGDGDPFAAATGIYEYGRERVEYQNSSGVALQIASLWAIDDETDHRKVLPLFEDAATSEQWILREYAQGFFRKLVKSYPDEMAVFLSAAARSRDDKLRRFVSETLRPVAENRWLLKSPDYSLSILRLLFAESSSYPRTSVGNHLSDLSKRHPELVYGIVETLVASGNPHSGWIAHRACRNLVKSDPIRVMDLLRVDHYTYKQRVYQRSDVRR